MAAMEPQRIPTDARTNGSAADVKSQRAGPPMLVLRS
ncbi:hypothetical protein ACVIJ6_005265 [Bradyrhizobium sp. USDA 4369]